MGLFHVVVVLLTVADAGAESVAKIIPDCPPDKPRVNCFVDPCWSAKYTGGTTCVANYCGGCNAECKPDCPPDKPLVNCLVDPCWSAKCPAGTRCVANYCGGCNAECKPDGCVYGGDYHEVGTSFPDIYSCNTCFCAAGNILGCTKLYCPWCWYNGHKYKPGDSFKSTDGCNKCWCTSDGTVGCTKRACIKLPVS